MREIERETERTTLLSPSIQTQPSLGKSNISWNISNFPVDIKVNDNIANHHYVKKTQIKEMRMMETSIYQLFTLNGDQLMI